MGKVRTDDQRVTVDIHTGSRDEVAYVDEAKAAALRDKHMARWSTLLERLK